MCLTQAQSLELWDMFRSTQLVEDVVVPLVARLVDHPGLLQQVGAHVRSNDLVTLAEAYLQVLPKATAVVVPNSLGIPNGLNRRRVTHTGNVTPLNTKLATSAGHVMKPLKLEVRVLTIFGRLMGLETSCRGGGGGGGGANRSLGLAT